MTTTSYNLHYQKLNDLLQVCAERQIELSVMDDKLRIEAPQGAVTPDLRAALAEHKAEIMDLLSRPAWRVDPDAEPLRIPLTWDQTPSEYLVERGLRVVGGDHNGTLYIAGQEVAA